MYLVNSYRYFEKKLRYLKRYGIVMMPKTEFAFFQLHDAHQDLIIANLIDQWYKDRWPVHLKQESLLKYYVAKIKSFFL